MENALILLGTIRKYPDTQSCIGHDQLCGECALELAEGKNGGKDGSISGRGWQRGQFPKRMLVDHMSLDWKSIEGTTALHCIDQRRINRQ